MKPKRLWELLGRRDWAKARLEECLGLFYVENNPHTKTTYRTLSGYWMNRKCELEKQLRNYNFTY